jgi:hypothetical protein
MRKGKVTQPQQRWLDVLREVPNIEVYLWRYPDDIDQILEVIK